MAPARVDRAGAVRDRDVEGAVLVTHTRVRGAALAFGNVVQLGVDAALSQQRSRVQVPSFPLRLFLGSPSGWHTASHAELWEFNSPRVHRTLRVRLSNGKTRVWLARDRGSIPRGSTERCSAARCLHATKGLMATPRYEGPKIEFDSWFLGHLAKDCCVAPSSSIN